MILSFILYITMKFFKRYHPILIIIAIACLIVFPRRSGYVMLLDFISFPTYSLSSIHRYDGLMWMIIQTLNVVLGGMVTQYLIMCGALIGL
jgi:hypothetical protein